MSQRFGILGLGNLASAIVHCALKAGVLDKQVTWGCTHSEESARLRSEALGIAVSSSRDLVNHLPGTSVLLVGLKPYQLAEVLPTLREQGLPADCVVISIAAGATLAQLEGWLGARQPIVRAMTNTPAQVGEGCTALCYSVAVTEPQQAFMHKLFASVGLAIDLGESYFDVHTALAGSGPAFVLTLMEGLADGAVKAGLPRKQARLLVPQLLKGTAALVEQTGEHTGQLRDKVTTPAGTTAAGLHTIEQGAVRYWLGQAVQAATDRCKELA